MKTTKSTMMKSLIASLCVLSLSSCLGGEDEPIIAPPPPPPGPATFTRQWKNDFESEDSKWYRNGVCTFDAANSMFIPEAVELVNGKCELTISRRTQEQRDKTKQALEDAGYDPIVDTVTYNSAEYSVRDTTLQGVVLGEMYGKFSSRMKVTAPPGVVTSFFLHHYKWAPGWVELLESSEIDIEFCGSTKEVQFAMHYKNLGDTKPTMLAKTVSLNGKDAGDGYHLWEIEWLPTEVSFYMDGEKLHTFTDQKFLDEMEFVMRADVNFWVTDYNDWPIGIFDDSQLPITTHYEYISYASWDQMPQ